MKVETGEHSFLVQEHRSWWAPLLRRMAGGWEVRETRTWEDCWQQWQERSTQFLVLEVEAESPHTVLPQLRSAHRCWPNAPIGVVMRAEWLPLRWSFREAGATVVAVSALELRTWGEMLRRFSSRSSQTPPPSRDLPSWSEVVEHLPWPRPPGG